MIHWKQRVQKLHQFDVETTLKKPMWRTRRYFVDFENGIHVEISTSKRWRFHEDVSIGLLILNLFIFEYLVQISRPRLHRLVVYDFLIAK